MKTGDVRFNSWNTHLFTHSASSPIAPPVRHKGTEKEILMHKESLKEMKGIRTHGLVITVLNQMSCQSNWKLTCVDW